MAEGENMEKYYFTSEQVTEGHPDKICDQISDAILDECLKQDPLSRVACETTAWTDAVHVMGEITTKAKVDFEKVARDTVEKIGYVIDDIGFNKDTFKFYCTLNSQSEDIAMGVNASLDDASTLGAGDQGMMFGYATDESEDYLPLTLHLANKLMTRLAEVRKNNVLSYLRPDGKGQVTVEYKDGQPIRIEAVVVSTQHADYVALEQLREDIRKEVILKSLPRDLIDENTKIYINPTGRFVVGGPNGDTGLTGRKIIADTYGGVASHGGGAFSGKDPTKVDRSAAYMARYIAKNIVANGFAHKCEVQLAYAIGVAEPVSIYVNTKGTGKVDDTTLTNWVKEHFDCRPASIIKLFNLRAPIYHLTSAYGHFGKEELPWEIVDTSLKNTLKF